MPFTQLTPLDDQGVRSNRPSHEVKWRNLTNIIPRDGELRRRPGFSKPLGHDSLDLPTGQHGTVVAIGEIHNPGSSAEGRSGFEYTSETIRPDATDSNSGWTRQDGSTTTNIHLDVDDPGTPDEDSMKSSAQGSTVALSFGATAGTFDFYAGGILRGRARLNGENGIRATLNFYRTSVSAANLLGSVDIITSLAGDEGDPEWQEFQIPIDPGITLSNITIVTEYESGSAIVAETLLPTGNGDDTEWEDATDGGAGAFGDVDDFPLFNLSPVDQNGISPTAAGDKQGFTIEALEETYDSFTSIQFLFSGEKNSTNLVWTPQINLLYKRGGTEYTISSGVKIASSFNKWLLGIIDIDPAENNPFTGSPWVAADITAGQWILEAVDNAVNYKIDKVGMYVFGVATSEPGVFVDYLAIDVLEVDADAAADHLIAGKDAWFVTTTQYLQITTPNFNDVGGAVPAITSGPRPLDHTTLYGQVYVVNGVDDTRRYPTAGGIFEALSTNLNGANPITGRCVEAFADRILYGWVNENGTVTPERIAWSNFQNGGDHSGTSAGDLDLLDTPGGVLALGVLTEDSCTAVKEAGVYILRRTGNSLIPFIRDVIDFYTGIVAPRTLQTVVSPEGNTVQLWLGFSPAKGLNVFMFDGSQVRAIGDEIHKELRDDTNPMSLASNAFAEIDPQNAGYWLSVPTGDALLPTSGFFYSLRSGQWYPFDLEGFTTSCAGIWTLPEDTGFTLVTGGVPTLVVGTKMGYPFKADPTVSFDVTTDGGVDLLTEDVTGGRLKNHFSSTIETGDLGFAGSDGFQLNVICKRIYLVYKDTGTFTVDVSASRDGGVTFNTTKSYTLGGGDDESIHTVPLDIEPIEGRRIRFKLDFAQSNQQDETNYSEDFKLLEAWVEWEASGDQP